MLYDRGDDDRDYLNGGAGDDILRGGDTDQLHGGTGADRFELDRNGAPVIEDFDMTEDRIEITYEGEIPTLSTEMTDAGLTLIADGEVVAIFDNLDTLDVSTVSLVAA